jgi:hypothetical protein
MTLFSPYAKLFTTERVTHALDLANQDEIQKGRTSCSSGLGNDHLDLSRKLGRRIFPSLGKSLPPVLAYEPPSFEQLLTLNLCYNILKFHRFYHFTMNIIANLSLGE